MKYSDVSGLTVDELNKKAKELKNDLFQAKMKNKLGQLGNPLEVRYLRKDIARIETCLVQKKKQ